MEYDPKNPMTWIDLVQMRLLATRARDPDLKTLLERCANEIEDLRERDDGEIDKLNDRIEELESEVEQLESAKSDAESALDELREGSADDGDSITELEAKNTALRDKIEVLEDANASLTKDRADAEVLCKRLAKHTESLKAELDRSKELIAELTKL